MSNCAVGADGALKDASEIQWFNDADDDTPITPPPAHPFKPSAHLQAADNTSTESSSGMHPHKRALSNADDAPIKKVAIQAAPKENDLDDILIPSIADGDDSSADHSEYTNNLDHEAEEADDTEEAYQKTKSLGDADRQARQTSRRTDRTADLQTIFTEEKGHLNPDTRTPGDGWWCNICKDAGLPAHQSFFQGSISTRRTHISR
ncbi:hypothetical protein C8R48DRAFT_669625 [Suillus tomentosus]|nr:hypothetical protein C8R48DRAFT_669625 [Suillus tomentosus]